MVFMINDVRCECGKLLLKKTQKGYELKCPRCKEIHLLNMEEARDLESGAHSKKRKENGPM